MSSMIRMAWLPKMIIQTSTCRLIRGFCRGQATDVPYPRKITLTRLDRLGVMTRLPTSAKMTRARRETMPERLANVTSMAK